MKKAMYITKEERKKCRKVRNAFVELYKEEDIVVMDVGKYGFVKMQYYKPPFMFNDVSAFTESNKLFTDLWKEWRNTQLLSLAKGTPMEDMEYSEIFQCLSKEKRNNGKKALFYEESKKKSKEKTSR